ncbi:hypothetical protein HJG60_008811 [Phyllostomus discolor]|uniref:Uncharacterized protein n=1 Tax=Phyllostomus discolor TaxID=89673 RepID=A0A833YSJ5_9CHIR|nr:hypothetical protein HJG60_008811 [Phyllostomus discolor]
MKNCTSKPYALRSEKAPEEDPKGAACGFAVLRAPLGTLSQRRRGGLGEEAQIGEIGERGAQEGGRLEEYGRGSRGEDREEEEATGRGEAREGVRGGGAEQVTWARVGAAGCAQQRRVPKRGRERAEPSPPRTARASRAE